MIKKIISVVGFSLFLFCNSGDAPSDCTPISDPDKNIELIYPKGGETFYNRQDLTIKWKVNPDKIDQVNIELFNSSKSIEMLERGIKVTEDICMDTVLKIGDSTVVPKGNYKLRISRYGDPDIKDISDFINIK